MNTNIAAQLRATTSEALVSFLPSFFMPHSGPGSTGFDFFHAGVIFCSVPALTPLVIYLISTYVVFGHVPSDVLNAV